MGWTTNIQIRVSQLFNEVVCKDASCVWVVSKGCRKAPPQDVKPNTPTMPVDKSNKLQQALTALLNWNNNIQSRLRFYRAMQKYLNNTDPCLSETNGKLCIMDTKTNEPIVIFGQKLGEKDSKFGIAYKVSGTKLAKLLKFSCKIMAYDEPGHKDEIALLLKINELVASRKCQNLPLTYKTSLCMQKCTAPQSPQLAKNGRYYLVLNELASTDLAAMFKASHVRSVYESILMQVIFALYTFHRMGYSHNDCHLGNFLIHKIQRGGYWLYKVGNHKVYVPNMGYLVVLWDFGLAETITNDGVSRDYKQALMPFSAHTKTVQKQFAKHGLVLPPEDFRTSVAKPVLTALVKADTENLEPIIKILKKAATSIIVDAMPPEPVLNIIRC